jgi:hypothetical protein
MEDVSAAAGDPADAEPCMPASAEMPCNALPTLQRNALRKLFDRPVFTPAEVAALGYRKLQQTEGVGIKGLVIIRQWLQAHGYDIEPEPTVPRGKPMSRRTGRNLEAAMRVLQAHGYVVQRSDDESLQKKHETL